MSTGETSKPSFALKYNNLKWLEDNKDNFIPPVCNYMMHGDGRLKVMYVGGPNIRKDFHLEEGEEFFYMVKGKMNLRILEQGKFKDIWIDEGEVFQLPGKIPHSPQRFENTMGLVIERERMKTEHDCLRYHVKDTTEILYEEWFYCKDLGTEIGPVIKRYFASEPHKTGRPTADSVTKNPPFLPDPVRVTEKPFHLKTWINKNLEKIQSDGSMRLWDKKYQSDIIALGAGQDVAVARGEEETWLWQLVGASSVSVKDGATYQLGEEDSLLITANSVFSHQREPGSVCLSVTMPWANKDRAFTHLPSTTENAPSKNKKD